MTHVAAAEFDDAGGRDVTFASARGTQVHSGSPPGAGPRFCGAGLPVTVRVRQDRCGVTGTSGAGPSRKTSDGGTGRCEVHRTSRCRPGAAPLGGPVVPSSVDRLYRGERFQVVRGPRTFAVPAGTNAGPRRDGQCLGRQHRAVRTPIWSRAADRVESFEPAGKRASSGEIRSGRPAKPPSSGHDGQSCAERWGYRGKAGRI